VSEHNRHAKFDFEIKYFLFWSYDPWFAEDTDIKDERRICP
jgi:hypothetical protein